MGKALVLPHRDSSVDATVNFDTCRATKLLDAMALLSAIPLSDDRIALPTNTGWVSTTVDDFEVLADELQTESGVPMERILEIWMEEMQPRPMVGPPPHLTV